MTLDEAIRQCRASLAGDSTIHMTREALGMLIDHAAAGQALRDTLPRPATVTLSDYVTLRDRFAMHAPTNLTRWKAGGTSIDYELTAADRWRYADAMMERRS